MPGCRVRRRRLGGTHELRDTEVEHFDRAGAGDDDVGWFQIAMHDARGVRGCQRVADLDRIAESRARCQRALAHHLRQGAPGHVFHDDAAPPVGLDDVVNGRDVRVIQRRQRLRFALEPGKQISIVQIIGAEHLDRDIPPETAVARAVDLSHSTGANRFQQVVTVRAAAPTWVGHSSASRSRPRVRITFTAGAGCSSPENLVRNLYANFGQAAKRELDGQLFNRLNNGGFVPSRLTPPLPTRVEFRP